MKMLNPQEKAITPIQNLCLQKSHQDCCEVVMSDHPQAESQHGLVRRNTGRSDTETW